MNDFIRMGYIKDYEYRISHYREWGRRQTISYKCFTGSRWEYPHEEYVEALYKLYKEAVKKNI
jgi:hypothetical protein